MSGLPIGWRMESVASLARGGLFVDGDWVESKDQDPSGGVRLTQLADVGVGEFRDRSDRWMRDDQAARLNCTFIEPDDVLIARMPDPIGRACLAPANLGRAVTAVDVAILRPARDDVDPRYVMWAINSPRVHERITQLQSGTTRKRVSRKNLASVQVPLPPLEEQRRIVELLEDHLSRLDAGEFGLETAKRRLASFEASVLSACREGDRRLLAEVAEIQGGIQKQAKRRPVSNRFPFLRVANVTAKGLDLDEVHEVELFGQEIDRYRLQVGDLLVVEGNGSPSQIGRAAVWDGSIADAVHQNHLIRVRPSPGLLPAYLEAAWNSPENRRELTRVSSSSSGLHTLSVSKLKTIEVPVPAIADQQAAIERLSELRTARSSLEREVVRAGRHATALRRALLAAAFSGRLAGTGSDVERVEEMAGV